jgi:cytochrome c biogenesis protein CcdA
MSDGLLAPAVGAGMLAAINPCGFALLPAYLALLVTHEDRSHPAAAIGRALLLMTAMTAGFLAVCSPATRPRPRTDDPVEQPPICRATTLVQAG